MEEGKEFQMVDAAIQNEREPKGRLVWGTGRRGRLQCTGRYVRMKKVISGLRSV